MVDRFSLYLIKPSHYGTTTDTSSNGSAPRSPPIRARRDARTVGRLPQPTKVLGCADVEIEIAVIDETNTRVRPERIADQIAPAEGGPGLVCLVGVQSNQFPHATDLARRFPRPGRAGGPRRVPCLRLPRDASADASDDLVEAAIARGFAVRFSKRGRGPPRYGVAGRLRGPDAAAL